MSVVIHEDAIAEMARGAGMAIELVRIAETIVVPIAQESLGDANEIVENEETGTEGWGLNPPPGPPMMRTETLQQSVHVAHPELDVAGVLCAPVCTYAVASRPSGQWRYDLILRDGEDGRDRGPYEFITQNPFFIYREYPESVSYTV